MQEQIKRRVTHGFKNHPIYRRWGDMMTRCYNAKHKAYQNYGGRGIEVCERWREPAFFIEDTLISFLEHQKEYGLRHTSLDRIDNNGNYSPENCRWATVREQSRNRGNNLYLMFRNEKRFLSDVACDFNMATETLKRRLDSGMDIEEAISKPVIKKRGPINWEGKEKSASELARMFGVGKTTLERRLELGWELERALKTPVDKRFSKTK